MAQITQSDIARKLEVTRVTVSKALRDHHDISIDMKRRVLETAKELGYYPNRLASNLTLKKTRTIGIIVPKISHYFFSSTIEAVYDSVFEKNYEAILMVSQENEERERKHLESLISMRVDGIMISISQNTKNYSIFETIKKMNIPLVFFDRIVRNMGFSCISVNDKKGSFELIDQAIKTGYKKIAHLAGSLDINIGNERLKGYKEALMNNGIPIKSNWVIETGFGEKEGYDGFMKSYQQKELPELIFAVTFPVALGVIRAAKKFDIDIPGDINIVCFGKSDYSSIAAPGISCVVQPTKELGRKSVEVLLSEIERSNQSEPQNIILDTTLDIYDAFDKKKIKIS